MYKNLRGMNLQGDKHYNFIIRNYDEDGNVFVNNIHSCKYYEMDDVKNNFSKQTDNFSTYSHNIRSLNGHWDDILDIINSANPIKFSVLAFQEVWSVPKTFSIPGYCKFEYSTRDKFCRLNPNCGGGVGFFIDEKYSDYEILVEESVFIPHVYE